MAVTATGRRIRKRKLKAEINVVPYIDVMLVLLIIFMVTAPLLNLGTDIHLPDSKAKALSTPKDPIVVSAYADGRYALKLPDADNVSMERADITARLRAIHDQNADATVLVNGDADASYQKITNAIDAIKDAGFDRVSLISRPVETTAK
jgi:biopolymer transport protein TolR